MPHLSMEFSPNLDGRVDFGALCGALQAAILQTGLFEPGAIRVRAIRCMAVAVADLLPQNAFIDMVFRIGAGRSEAEKKAAGDAIFEAAVRFLHAPMATPHFALSLEIREIAPTLNWKRNTMHARLRPQADAR